MPLDFSLIKPTTPLMSYGDIMQQRLGMQHAMQQQELGQMEIAQKRQQMADIENLKRLSAETGGDPMKMATALRAAGKPEMAQKIELGMMERAKAEHDAQKASLEKINAFNQAQLRVYNGIKDEASYQAALPLLAQNAKASGFNIDTTKSDHPPVYDPNFVESKKAQMMTFDQQLKAKELDLKADAEMWGQPVAAKGKDGKPTFIQQNKKTGEVRQVEGGYQPIPSAAATLMVGGGGLTPEALDMLIEKYRKTGTLDADLGRNQVLRAKVINGAAEKDKSEGVVTDLAGNKQAYKSDTESLKKLQFNRDQLVSFESTALKNLKVFEDAAKKVIDSGSPLLNKPLRYFAGAAAGSPEQAVFTAARQIVIPEFAKINSGSMNGVLSDSARHEVASLIPENATLAQIVATANLLKQDAHNRRVSMDDMLKEVKGRGSGKTESQPAKVGTKSMLEAWMRDNPTKKRSEGIALMKQHGYTVEGL